MQTETEAQANHRNYVSEHSSKHCQNSSWLKPLNRCTLVMRNISPMVFAMSGNASAKAWPACKVGDSFVLGLNDLVGRGPRGWDLTHPRIERKRKAPRVWLVSGARTMSILQNGV